MLVIVNNEKIENYLTPVEWYRENQEWVRKWADNIVSIPMPQSIEEFNGFQIFKTESPSQKIEPLYKERHLDQILLACIFSKASTMTDPSQRITTMSGFFEQVGRLPTPEDKVVIEYIEDRWMKEQHTDFYFKTYFTDCRLALN